MIIASVSRHQLRVDNVWTYTHDDTQNRVMLEDVICEVDIYWDLAAVIYIPYIRDDNLFSLAAC